MPIVLNTPSNKSITIDTSSTGNNLLVSSNISTSYTVSGNVFSGNGATLTGSAGFPAVQVFTSPGSFTVPATTNRIKVTIVSGSDGAPGQPGGYVAVANSNPNPAYSGNTISGGIGGSGGTGGSSTFGAYVTQTSSSVTVSGATLVGRGVRETFGFPLSSCYGKTGGYYRSGSSVVYIQGPFPPSIPITIGNGGGGGGGGSGALGSITSAPVPQQQPNVGIDGTSASGTTGGAGAPSRSQGPFVGMIGAAGEGGGGAGGIISTSLTAGTTGSSGTRGTSNWNGLGPGYTPSGLYKEFFSPLPSMNASGVILVTTANGATTALPGSGVTGGRGGTGDWFYYCNCSGLPVNAVFRPGNGGAGGAGGYSGIVVVEYN